MDKKTLIILVIAILLIVVGGYLILSNHPAGDVSGDSFKIPLKNQDFTLFEIKTPKGSNFTLDNEASGVKYYVNKGEYSSDLSGIIINKGLTDVLLGNNSIPISNASDENIYSSVFKNETVYKYVSNQSDVDIILIGDDINLLKEVSDSIKIKDVSDL